MGAILRSDRPPADIGPRSPVRPDQRQPRAAFGPSVALPGGNGEHAMTPQLRGEDAVDVEVELRAGRRLDELL